MATATVPECIQDQSSPAAAPVQQTTQRKPSLKEGHIQSCQGYVQRRSKILKRYKKEWLDIIPGPTTHQIVKHGKSQKTLHVFQTASPNIQVETLSDSPNDSNFLAFRLVNTDINKEISRFRAENIVQMRRFMASFGAKGPGMFTKEDEENRAILIEATHGLFDVVHPSEDEIHQRQQMFQKHVNTAGEKGETQQPADAPPSYWETVKQLPRNFYFQADEESIEAQITEDISHPGTIVPIYDSQVPLPKSFRRQWHDSFLPPNGPPVFYPVSIGYGAEVGLEHGLQALWNPIQKSYFFIDHINKVTFFDDPRPRTLPELQLTSAKCTCFTAFGDNHREAAVPRAVCSNNFTIITTAERAHSKPHGHVLYACGIHGQSGTPGRTGVNGNPGFNGEHGRSTGANGGPGGMGEAGGPGSPGLRGQDGTPASDVTLNIWGDSKRLNVSGTVSFFAELGGKQSETVLFVNCRGGNGGSGGPGGNGGAGGIGGTGGTGAPGFPGESRRIKGRGGPGGPGGDGGSGGMGGEGGPGAQGGNGGNAQFGGMCVLKSVDPQLLMLVEADCMAGTPGSGGKGGQGGSGGRGGYGGIGGPGGPGGKGKGLNNNSWFGPAGRTGLTGLTGYPGQDGITGERGHDGQPARNGAILWVISSPNGGVLHQSGTRYDVEVTSLKVASAIDDGIFEPNERILVTGVVVLNSGGLPLPRDVTLFMPSTKTIQFEPTRFELPSDQLNPGQNLTVPVTFHGRIFDQPPPNICGQFISSAEFHPRAELLGRPFEKSFLHQKLVVQYPVKLVYLRCSENLCRGEVSILEIGVQNISTIPYGDVPGSGGKVVLQIHLDARIIPIGSASVELSTVPYTITHNPQVRDSTYIQIHKISPGETVNVQVTIQMEGRAELFDRCYWQADLYLRDKLIEYNFEKIRITASYIATDPPADVLMITSEAISRKEFVFWQRVLENLGVTVDFWDTTRYNGLSVDSCTNTRHQVSWEGRYSGSLMLYPHCNLKLLHGIDIVRHFHGPDYRDNLLKEMHSSAVFFMPETAPRGRQSEKFDDRGDQALQKHLSAVEEAIPVSGRSYSGRHFNQPGTTSTDSRPYLKWEKKCIKKLEKEIPAQSPIVLSRMVNIQSAGIFKYSYGEVDIRRIPILRSSKFLMIDGAGGNYVDMSLDDPNLHPGATEVPLASNFAQVFLATLYGIPLRCKLKLLKTTPNEALEGITSQVIYYLPNGLRLSKQELTMICMTWEIADEVYSCSGNSTRIRELAQDVESNTAAYKTYGRVILRGMELLSKEVKLRKKKLSNSQVNEATSETIRHIGNISQALRGNGVDYNNLEPLVSLFHLQDNERVHRSHQHWVEDGRWNLCGL